MSEHGFGSWREKKRADRLTQKFKDLRVGGLTIDEDIVTDTDSADAVSKQIMNKQIVWFVRFHGVVLPSEFSHGNVDPNCQHYTTKNCVNNKYTNFYIFENSNSVDLFILSPHHRY